ncbi:MAG TPA: acetyl-CoA carboxylase biotin carboxylase subunit [Methylomusa anaerophila]|uniref:Biotin carboxylase n=1 Tax=Methylomusa anaerophila TaxID=1930071 RepID=A0A348AKZ8_9FIRM|nr:acetyl-CoA carboxylase biotin carboxylase subunit [Methylomusa anaerophila]BBB91746.1 biotin carboxylase [Methylomusa anaerophila]HML88517.1 acetyl-CoA carboxylase biotin carboxylase subunit [Methylomusa anaerophila]
MFDRVLIANRGEIAIRIIRACQELGIETVAVYSDVDADSLHVQLADYACNIGPADAAHSYLNGKAIVAAAEAAQADAIHPGYGFLSENADFAELVTKEGLAFIGPSADVIRQVGNKDAARDVMRSAGISMSQGSDLVDNLDNAICQAESIGYPVILKPIAGGGGHGMFVVNNQPELHQAVRKYDASSLASTPYYFEKYICNARHIEVQIVADNFGHIVHLGERECSLQRRNQKILEEAPSSILTPEMRQKVGELAVRAAKSIHYTNVGTVEFLLDCGGNFYFMEINPRIQVEHGITEMVSGVDLVKTQIQIAAGHQLTFSQADVKLNGHAIECRINAENPNANFMPCPGQIDFYHQPGGPNVRVDSGVCAGSVVQPYYDSLITKVIAYGKTRGDAIKTMERALGEFIITGIDTTIDFHKNVLRNPQFRMGNVDTQFVYKQMIS